MEALFLKLVNMSITASYLVLPVLLFRVLLKKAPKSIRCVLWGLVGLRLVFPFSIESVLSLIPSAEPLPEEFLYAANPQVNTGIAALNNGLEAFKYNIIFSCHDHQLTQTVANRIIEITEDGIIDRMCTYDEYMHISDLESAARQ